MMKNNFKALLLIASVFVTATSSIAQTWITFDNSKVPFSYYGSYLTLTKIAQEKKPSGDLFLKNSYIHVLKIELCDAQGEGLKQEVVSTPYKMTLKAGESSCEICFEDIKTLRFKCQQAGVKFTLLKKGDSDIFRIKPGQWGIPNFTLTSIQGESISSFKYLYSAKQKNDTITTYFSFLPDKNGVCEFSIELSDAGRNQVAGAIPFEKCKENVEKVFNNWLSKYPRVAPKYSEARDLALYINWSSVVSPYLRMPRYGMYMSKNWMNAIWSWDNCFNAMATACADKKLAMDQIYLFFDTQADNGAFPDNVNDLHVNYGYVKPPIYGIVLTKLASMKALNSKQLPYIYDHICRLTNFWFNEKDSDKNGIPEYSHGFDSGWDNSTAFDDLKFPVESADLCAYLITQMDYLSELATQLKKHDESIIWKEKSDKMLKLLLGEFWVEDQFISRSIVSKKTNTPNSSLISFLPIILGKKLPVDIRNKMISEIKSGGYLTDFGLATESTTSPNYKSDGYWRGPIWAPSTYMIVQGLLKCDEKELAADISLRFCELCKKSGFPENFNALTGDGLCDPSYTWTSSTFLLLVDEFSRSVK